MERKPKIRISSLKTANSRKCLYCKITNNYNSFNMTIENGISGNLFQKLFEENWLKYANSLSKIDVEKSCCKLYQSRVELKNFKLNKHQKKVMKNFRLFLKGEFNENTKFINNFHNNINNNIKKEKQKYSDIYIEYINNIINDYLNNNCFEKLINNYNLNCNEIVNDIKNKINTIINNNRKFGDYSSNFLILISNFVVKNKDQNLKINIKQILFENFKEFYNNCNNNLFDIKLDEKIGRINFFVKDKNYYTNFLKINNDNIKNNNNTNTNNTNSNNNFNNTNNYNNTNNNNNTNKNNNYNNYNNNNNNHNFPNNNINNVNNNNTNNNNNENIFYSLEYFP